MLPVSEGKPTATGSLEQHYRAFMAGAHLNFLPAPSGLSRRFLGGAITLLLLFWYLFRGYPTQDAGSLPFNPQDLHDPGDIRHILNETLGFQKIFVINLPDRLDKRDAMVLAARATGIKLEFIEAVSEVPPKIVPPVDFHRNLEPKELANWRSHMLAVHKIVEEGLTSALIMEDDVDWDIRIKPLLQDFARGTRMLVQPLRSDHSSFMDPTVNGHGPEASHVDLPLSRYVETLPPKTSPYGDLDRWDLLWLGHCGTKLPKPEDPEPLGRVTHFDESVPETQHITFHFGNSDLMTDYPNHTRIYSRVHDAVCTLAYGLTQDGARRWLHELAITSITAEDDVMFSQMCSGQKGRPNRPCVTVQPQLFEHHRPKGNKASWSDISWKPTDENPMAFTRNVRWSTRLNLHKLLYGAKDYVDIFPDGEPARDLGTW